MAEQPSSLNPFLGSEKPRVSEPLTEGVSGDFSSPTSGVSKNVSSPADTPDASEIIPTPSSKWRHRVIRRGMIALGLVVIIAGIVYWWFREADRNLSIIEDAPQSVIEETLPIQPTLNPETDGFALPEDSANYESENFKAGEIVIGGELQFIVDEDEVGALTVENIRGEAFTEKNKQEVKLVVSWTTNKLTLASVRYSKGIGQTERVIDEEDYSYNHSVIIAGLDPASTYLYTIDAADRYGNQVKSEPHAVFTGARTVSLFDLIAGAIGEVFGWAVSSR